MAVYRSGKFAEFLGKYDWNKLFQEICTIFIGLGLGLYFYEKQELWGPLKTAHDGGLFSISRLPTWLTSETARPYLNAGIAIIITCTVIKILIYCSLFDANKLKFRGKKYPRPKGIDLNGICQEILTALLGITVGLFTTPVVKNALVFEKSEYPDPTIGIILTFTCILSKFLLYSHTLNFNTFSSHKHQGFFNPQNIKPTLRKADWNNTLHEFTTACVGIGLGFYLYESKIVFLADKLLPGFSDRVGDRVNSVFDRIFGAQLVDRFKVDFTPELFKDENAQFFIMAGAILLGVCVLIKFLLYSSMWDANATRAALVGGKRTAKRQRKFDVNGALEEGVTLAFTSVFGIVTTPVVKNAFMEQKQEYTLHITWIVLLVILGWLKLALVVGAVDFRSSKK